MTLYNALKYLAIALCLLPVCACSDCGEPEPAKPTEQPNIIFDTDIISSTDDLVALCTLYNYIDQGKCNLLGIVVDREGEVNAACADVFNTFYGHPHIPIGLVREGIDDARVFNDYSGVVSWTDDHGNPLFPRSIADYSTLPDGHELYRTLLQAAPDKSVTIVSVGFVTALSQLLTSDGGPQLVSQKVRAIYMMAGRFGPGAPDYNLAQGPEFAHTFFERWPADVPIYFSPSEVGRGIYYSKQQLLDDFTLAGLHPLREVYARYDEDITQRMWDVLPLIQAVEGDSWFNLSPRGYVTLDADCNTTFTPSPNGKCRYQIPGDEAWNDATLNKIRSLVRP